jgi:murein DD-endopeptidase MepM/ murein hydrolase activator NlpD
MAKVKYRYNSETLTYEKVRLGVKDYMRIIGRYSLFALVISLISIAVFTYYYESPKEVGLRREIEFLEAQLGQMQNDIDTLAMVASTLSKQDDEVYRSIFGVSRYPDHLRNPGVGGADRYKNIKGYESSEAIIETKKKISLLQRQLVAQSRSMEELFQLASNKAAMMQSIPAIQPVSNKDLTQVASGFGQRIHPIYKIPKMHWGIDFTAPTGTEIYATGNGTIRTVEKLNSGFGYHVVIAHGSGYETLYAHMSKILVRQGQKVKRGQVIGLVGNTGTSVGPHLHYEVMKNGEKVNPAHYFYNDLTPQQYTELLERASIANQSFD